MTTSRKASGVKKINRSGRTLVVYVKDLCDRTGARYGDYVKISLEPIDLDEDDDTK